MFTSEIRRQQMLVAAGDALSLAVSVTASALVNEHYHGMQSGPLGNNLVQIASFEVLVCAVWIFSARALGLYDVGNRRGERLLAIIKASIITALLLLALVFLLHTQLHRLFVGLALALSVILIPTTRAVVHRIIAAVYANPNVSIPLAIVGCNRVAHYVGEQILNIFKQYELIGFIQEFEPAPAECLGYPVFGGIDTIPGLIDRYHNLEIALVLPDFPRDLIEKVTTICERRNVRWRFVPPLTMLRGASLRVDMIGEVPLIGPSCPNLEGLNFTLKRLFDLFVGSVALLVAAPVMLIAAAAIRLFDGSPVLFRQSRVGIHGKPFQLLKFRTMRAAAPDALHRDYVRTWIGANGNGGSSTVNKISSDPRLTSIGRWLRWFSIDELPQLINVLRGDMSLVGPRPALAYERELYQDWHRRRLSALPGITGLWQVSGRNQLTFDQMVNLDISYIERWSFGEDLRILLKTVPAMFGGGY